MIQSPSHTEIVTSQKQMFSSLYSGILKGLPEMVSSVDAPEINCSDTIFPLKEIQRQCQSTSSTANQQHVGVSQEAPTKRRTPHEQNWPYRKSRKLHRQR